MGGATRRVATYNRFAGKTGPVKAVTPKSFIAKEGGEEVRRERREERE